MSLQDFLGHLLSFYWGSEPITSPSTLAPIQTTLFFTALTGTGISERTILPNPAPILSRGTSCTIHVLSPQRGVFEVNFNFYKVSPKLCLFCPSKETGQNETENRSHQKESRTLSKPLEAASTTLPEQFLGSAQQ